MFNLFGKKRISTLLALLSIAATSNVLMADEYCDTNNYGSSEQCCNSDQDYNSDQWCNTNACCDTGCNRLYIGGFGGELFSNSTRISQRGTAFFEEAVGGPLDVDARGHARKKKDVGFGGVQVGYEWKQCPYTLGCSNWSLTPAAELEAFWYRHERKGHLINLTERLPEHDFVDSFRLNVGVYLVNGIINFNNCGGCFSKFTPYVGGGIGAARIFLNKAKSTQIEPPEAGINHFNSGKDDTNWAFAAQVKAGLRYNICDRWHIFGEYRYLYIDTTHFILGSTRYSTHAPTSPWDIKMKDITYNAFAFGIQIDLY